jgi:hypothetical protein
LGNQKTTESPKIARVFLVWDLSPEKKKDKCANRPLFLQSEYTIQQVTGDIGMISPRLLLVLLVTCWLAQSHAITSFVSTKGLHINDLTFSLAESIEIDVVQPIQAIRIGVMIAHAWPQDLEGNIEI